MKIAMLVHRPLLLLTTLAFCLCSETMLVSSIYAGNKIEDRVAIIKIVYEGFEPEQERRINFMIDTTFANLAAERFKSAAATREALWVLGILPEALRDPRQYVQARDTLRLKHTVVIHFEQLGTFVHGLVRLFSVDLPEPVEYPIGTTLDLLEDEIQQAARVLLDLIPPKPKKRWPYILAGVGGASLVATAYLVFKPEERKELPVPPDVQKLP